MMITPVISLTLPYPPSANHYKRHMCSVSPKHPVVAFLYEEAKSYQVAARNAGAQANVQPIEGDVEVTVRVYRPRRVGDLENSLKVLLDSLQGVAYGNDKQIKRIVAELYEDKFNPRVEIDVAPITAPTPTPSEPAHGSSDHKSGPVITSPERNGAGRSATKIGRASNRPRNPGNVEL